MKEEISPNVFCITLKKSTKLESKIYSSELFITPVSYKELTCRSVKIIVKTKILRPYFAKVSFGALVRSAVVKTAAREREGRCGGPALATTNRQRAHPSGGTRNYGQAATLISPINTLGNLNLITNNRA